MVVGEVIDGHRVEDLDMDRAEDFVRECRQREKWIINNWARHFRAKDVPYVITRTKQKVRENGALREISIFRLWKECRRYTEKEFSAEGWNIVDQALVAARVREYEAR